MRDFSIGAGQLGSLSAAYFYAYVLMQMPMGAFVDRWGARQVLFVGAMAAAAGSLIFSTSGSLGMATAGRVIIGGSTAVAWVATLKLATHWFPAKHFALISGLSLMIGNIGALFAQVPLRILVESYGWRTVGISSAAAIFGIGIIAWLFVRNDPTDRGYATYAPLQLQKTATSTHPPIFRGFRRIFGYRNMWLIFLAQGGFLGALLSFTGLWGPPFLKARFAISSQEAAAITSLMTLCFAIASPLCGYVSDRIKRRKPVYVTGAVVAAIGWSTLFYAPLSLTAFTVVAGITSVACAAIILGFAFAKESVPVQYSGTVAGVINGGNMLGPTLMQPGIGLLLDQHWTGAMANGARIYGVDAFQFAFGAVAVWAVCTAILLAFTTETHCQQRTEA
jgi:sugar phosphate permease